MPSSLESIEAFKGITNRFDAIKRLYDKGKNPLPDLFEIGAAASKALANHASVREQGRLEAAGKAGEKVYDVFVTKDGRHISRPIRQDLYLKNPIVFKRLWERFIDSIDCASRTATEPNVNSILYTCISAVSCAYDLFKPGSRKTPGTFFEILIGAVIGEISGLAREKQVSIPGSRYKVPTDIVLKNENGPKLVIPTKITTRERIVQVWAQQRILSDVFKRGEYLSVLVSMSELQRDGDEAVNEICVPGQIGLFQEYLSKVSGMYYLDVPKAYRSPSITSVIKVGDLSDLLNKDLSVLLSKKV